MYKPMKTKQKLLVKSFKYTVIILLIMTAISSCNLFFSALHGRENIFDEGAQITGFISVPSSDNSIVTMWNWKDPPTWLYDDRITEIRIQHSVIGYPDNLDFIFGETFKNNNKFQHEWENLIPGITHYFSLFPKSSDDGKDTWYAPIHSKMKLPGKIKTITRSINDAWTVDDTLIVNSGINTGSLSATSVIIIEIDIPGEMKIKSAVINPAVTLGIQTPTNQTFYAYPLLQSFNEFDGYMAWHQVEDQTDPSIQYLVGEGSGVVVPGTNNILNNVALDITSAVLRAASAGNNQIVLKMDGVATNVINLPYNDFLIVKYFE